MRVRQRRFRGIPHTRIAADTRGFGKSGIGHKKWDGMFGGILGAVRGTKLSGTWNKLRRISSGGCVPAALTLASPKNDFYRRPRAWKWHSRRESCVYVRLNIVRVRARVRVYGTLHHKLN
jgi:hypothetical protein